MKISHTQITIERYRERIFYAGDNRCSQCGYDGTEHHQDWDGRQIPEDVQAGLRQITTQHGQADAGYQIRPKMKS